ncbi:MAG: PHP domain-containing protein [Methylacidiphilales bacterium]|nr:PHP domain-containing protein [Candidatus Methylacidiphilales bacterium]MDW8350074.1 PHP domain-containing protein [Verrucomicrobiae bacterium]
MKKILIFTAGFGEGHNTAARNIQHAIETIAGTDASADIHDLFHTCYGKFNDLMRRLYLTAINKTPRLWQTIYDLLDNTPILENNLATLSRMKASLANLLREHQPDAIVSTYPVYNYLFNELRQEGHAQEITQFTIITDSISINSLWYRTPSDYFLVPNQQTADILLRQHIPPHQIQNLGFPVPIEFADPHRFPPLPDLTQQNPPHPRILYIINSGKSKAPRIVKELLENHTWHLTIAVGKDHRLRETILHIIDKLHATHRADVLGWTDQMPRLLKTHHFVVTKAGGATIQEAIAAACPIIINQIVPGQEEGNYDLIRHLQGGILAEKPSDVARHITHALQHNAALWSYWRSNLQKAARPDAALRIAEFILSHTPSSPHPHPTPPPTPPPHISTPTTHPSILLCDFHTHTTYSDGKLTIRELVDFYGQRRFDCLAITDHLCDPRRLIGKLCNLTGLVLPPHQIQDYFDTIEKEKKRAWQKYSMILLTGIEFNKDGLTPKQSAHLLGLDLTHPIDPSLSLKDTIHAIHAQGALAVASHPHEFQSTWGRNTLYLWEHLDEFIPLIDAWEIANRDDLYTPIGLKRLPFLANSDFHKPKHIHSWKTLLYCEKHPEAIKQCIRENLNIAITLYRGHRFTHPIPHPFPPYTPPPTTPTTPTTPLPHLTYA